MRRVRECPSLAVLIKAAVTPQRATRPSRGKKDAAAEGDTLAGIFLEARRLRVEALRSWGPNLVRQSQRPLVGGRLTLAASSSRGQRLGSGLVLLVGFSNPLGSLANHVDELGFVA